MVVVATLGILGLVTQVRSLRRARQKIRLRSWSPVLPAQAVPATRVQRAMLAACVSHLAFEAEVDRPQSKRQSPPARRIARAPRPPAGPQRPTIDRLHRSSVRAHDRPWLTRRTST